MKNLTYISGIIAIISVVLAVVTRLFLDNTGLFGLKSLSYLRVTNTMLLFTITLLVFRYVSKK